MKKKLLLSLFILLSLVLLAGCGEKKKEEVSDKEQEKEQVKLDYVLFRCGVGNPDISVNYDEYKMKGNEILEFKSYDIKKFSSKEEMEKKYDFYNGLGIYEIEKISDTELKLIEIDPTNIYKYIEIENGYEEVIENSEKQGDFCQISKDGKTFEEVTNNLSTKDAERNAWEGSIYDLGDDYDSEIFYIPGADVTYKMLDGFESKDKGTGKKSADETFDKKDSSTNISYIKVFIEDSSYHAYASDGHSKGSDSASYSKRKWEEDYSPKNKVTDIKTSKEGNYNVYYFHEEDYVVSDMPAVRTILFFDLNDDYYIEIDITYNSKTSYDDIKNTNLSSFESLIKSFELKKIS